MKTSRKYADNRNLTIVVAKYLALSLIVFMLCDVERREGFDSIVPDNIQSGDVVFRMGRGLYSSLFAQIGSNPVPFSHVGIYFEQNEIGYVIHAEASDLTGIGYARMEPLSLFLGIDRASSCSIYRPKFSSDEQKKALYKIALDYVEHKIPFDSDFDLKTNERFYCTELVWKAFKEVGIDIAPRHDVSAKNAITGRLPQEFVSLGNIVHGGVLVSVAKD